jgi:hypothetical protein
MMQFIQNYANNHTGVFCLLTLLGSVVCGFLFILFVEWIPIEFTEIIYPERTDEEVECQRIETNTVESLSHHSFEWF